jgi:hypothetical protein
MRRPRIIGWNDYASEAKRVSRSAAVAPAAKAYFGESDALAGEVAAERFAPGRAQKIAARQSANRGRFVGGEHPVGFRRGRNGGGGLLGLGGHQRGKEKILQRRGAHDERAQRVRGQIRRFRRS